MGGFRLPQQPSHQQTRLANQTMCDVVAVSPDLFRRAFVGVFGPSGRDRRYDCCVNTDSPLGRSQREYCWWGNTREPGLPSGTTQRGRGKMEAEERIWQPQEITRKFEQLFPILSTQHNSLQHLTTIIIPQIIKSLSESGCKYLFVFCSRVTFKKNYL